MGTMVLLGAIGGWIVGILVAIGLVVLIVVAAKQHMQRVKGLRDAIAAVPGFTPSQEYISSDAETAFAVDERTNRICLAKTGNPAEVRVIEPGDLLEVDLWEDGGVLSRSARSSRLRGVMMSGSDIRAIDMMQNMPGQPTIRGGSVVAPQQPVPPGKVRQLQLWLTVNDSQTPLHIVNFINIETDRTDSNYVRKLNDARGWFNWFTLLIEKAERELPEAAAPQSATGSVADELAKLVQLRDSGALTPAEFAEQKARLLARS
jgi:hypothetical protein